MSTCLVCGRQLSQIYEDWPWPALEFKTIGNFRSTILDCWGPQLKFYICDVCIIQRLDRIKIIPRGEEELGSIREDVQKWYETTSTEELN